MVNAIARLEGVSKRYGEVEALTGIDLEIGAGGCTAVLGPNGAGKTTAISIMLGLRRPTAGRALLFGADPTDRAVRARCGAMLQESGVPGPLTVAETVALFSAHYASPLPLGQVLGLAGLEAKRRSRVSTLSGGERQRLYYAIAICGDPEVLFLDEPTVGMDVQARRALLEDVRAFLAVGKTIVLTTHYLDEADQLANRVVVIDHGRVIADAPPAEIKAMVPGRRVSFRADPALTPERLRSLGADVVRMDDGVVRLLSNDPGALVASLAAAGVPLRDLEVAGADLEEAFLALTAGPR